MAFCCCIVLRENTSVIIENRRHQRRGDCNMFVKEGDLLNTKIGKVYVVK